ncbi:MAG: hypothetical protein CVT63_01035 [Candidatus Anoxymicrobium japonicum]|uniref:Uncharacterized protein n=1 Tax=Candidatus Anoxymicrobium japonicum TaxID=2013648 RepID=A0A2N3G837_9ACTN|nr:MAG: hypothetical protein CVT63_01035 [Candidatus Anoxymicrobium japonicum]
MKGKIMRKHLAYIVVLVVLTVAVAFSMSLSAGFAGESARPGTGIGQWQRLSSGGFGKGSANLSVTALAQCGGKLYAGVSTETIGSLVMVKNGSTWTEMSNPGFGNADNKAVARMAAFNGKLYVGTGNESGCEVWRFDGPGKTNWTRVVSGGFGKTGNKAVGALVVFNGKLYASTINMSYSFSGVSSAGAEIYSTGDGAAWTPEMTGGFGNTENIGVTALCEYGSKLYAGTDRVRVTTEFVDFTHVKVIMTSLGCELWKMTGATWAARSKIAGDGITDKRNAGISAMSAYSGKLYVGTTNGDGSLIYDISAQKTSDETYSSSGLFVYSYNGASITESVRGGFESTDDMGANSFEVVNAGGKSMLLLSVLSAAGVGKLKAFDGNDWFSAADPGMGNPNNKGITSLEFFDGLTYAGTTNETQGCEVWAGTPPTSRAELSKTWYLAEGCTNGGFETWILIQNPNSVKTTAQVTYMTPTGERKGPAVDLAPNSRKSINVAESVPSEWSVSTVISADQPIVAERAMYWNNRKAGHDSVGVTAPFPVWYLAEGCTNGGFETWVLIQNPGDVPAMAVLTYMTDKGKVDGPTVDLPAHSRKSVDVAEKVPGEWNVSTKVTADQPVIAERAVYWNNRNGGHDSIGVTTASSVWYLAEGSTNGGFETWVLVQNSGDVAVNATLTFMTPSGSTPGPTVNIPANSRVSVDVGETVQAQWSISTKVTADRPVIAERAVYWGSRVEGHDSIGVTCANDTWYMAEGSTNGGFETWVLIQNPGEQETTANVVYMTPNGEKQGPVVSLPPNGRVSINISDVLPGEWSVSTKVTANHPVICERSVYWGNRTGGTNSIGAVI